MKYLVETRLVDLAKVIFCDSDIRLNSKLDRFRPDIFIVDKNLIIEFDGPRHFTNSKVVLRDYKIDKYVCNNNLNIIHVPYFVQISEDIYNLLFSSYKKLNDNIRNILVEYMYPHGFIDKKAPLPADFCSIGIERFEYMLDYYSIIKKDIIQSMNNQVNVGKDILEVYPLNKREYYNAFKKK